MFHEKIHLHVVSYEQIRDPQIPSHQIPSLGDDQRQFANKMMDTLIRTLWLGRRTAQTYKTADWQLDVIFLRFIRMTKESMVMLMDKKIAIRQTSISAFAWRKCLRKMRLL